MPPTATPEDIKAYLAKVEKGQIIAQNLPACRRCALEAIHFKIHVYRERRFLIIVDMIVKAVHGVLVRFRCPGCGKTWGAPLRIYAGLPPVPPLRASDHGG